jgi:hypothetical protein
LVGLFRRHRTERGEQHSQSIDPVNKFQFDNPVASFQ